VFFFLLYIVYKMKKRKGEEMLGEKGGNMDDILEGLTRGIMEGEEVGKELSEESRGLLEDIISRNSSVKVDDRYIEKLERRMRRNREMQERIDKLLAEILGSLIKN
jgi:hypothetical protein